MPSGKGQSWSERSWYLHIPLNCPSRSTSVFKSGWVRDRNVCHSCVFVYIARLMGARAGSLLCLSYLQLTQGSLMCVVQVISSWKKAMTINYFPLVLSSFFCPLFVTPYNSCPSALHLLRHWHAEKMGSCRGLAACDTPAALGWRTRLAGESRGTAATAGCSWGCWQEHLAQGELRFCCHSTPSAIFSRSLRCRTTGPSSCLGIKAAQPRP